MFGTLTYKDRALISEDGFPTIDNRIKWGRFDLRTIAEVAYFNRTHSTSLVIRPHGVK